MSSKLTSTMTAALRKIASEPVYVTNRGLTSAPREVRRPTYQSLKDRGLVQPNGASRGTVEGMAARRITLTAAGREAL